MTHTGKEADRILWIAGTEVTVAAAFRNAVLSAPDHRLGIPGAPNHVVGGWRYSIM